MDKKTSGSADIRNYFGVGSAKKQAIEVTEDEPTPVEAEATVTATSSSRQSQIRDEFEAASMEDQPQAEIAVYN